VGSLDKRLEALEERIGEPEDEGAEIRRRLMVATINEYSSLRWCGAHTHWIQDGVAEPIPPENKPAYYLGDGYTSRQLTELAIQRVWEREGLPEDLMEPWMEEFERLSERAGIDVEKVVGDGA
jgi:hypothetical protein